MSHIFIHIGHLRPLIHLAQKLDQSERQESIFPITGFLLVRHQLSPVKIDLYKLPDANSPSAPRRLILRSSTTTP